MKLIATAYVLIAFFTANVCIRDQIETNLLPTVLKPRLIDKETLQTICYLLLSDFPNQCFAKQCARLRCYQYSCETANSVFSHEVT